MITLIVNTLYACAYLIFIDVPSGNIFVFISRNDLIFHQSSIVYAYVLYYFNLIRITIVKAPE